MYFFHVAYYQCEIKKTFSIRNIAQFSRETTSAYTGSSIADATCYTTVETAWIQLNFHLKINLVVQIVVIPNPVRDIRIGDHEFGDIGNIGAGRELLCVDDVPRENDSPVVEHAQRLVFHLAGRAKVEGEPLEVVRRDRKVGALEVSVFEQNEGFLFGWKSIVCRSCVKKIVYKHNKKQLKT